MGKCLDYFVDMLAEIFLDRETRKLTEQVARERFDREQRRLRERIAFLERENREKDRQLRYLSPRRPPGA